MLEPEHDLVAAVAVGEDRIALRERSGDLVRRTPALLADEAASARAQRLEIEARRNRALVQHVVPGQHVPGNSCTA
jgi:hypothetical protein